MSTRVEKEPPDPDRAEIEPSAPAASRSEEMKPNQLGLIYRLRRAANQIHGQHELLRPIFSELANAISSQLSREAQTAAFRLDGGMRAHFLLEEEVVFPALRGMCPEREDELIALIEEHSRFLVDLDALVARILDRDLAAAERCLSVCSKFIAEHELREEAVIQGIIQSGGD